MLPVDVRIRGLHGFRVHADSAYGGYFHLDQGRWTLESDDFPEGYAYYVHVL